MVPSDEIVRGFAFDEGEYVVVTDQELEELEPQKSREIDLQRFVERDGISPLYFDNAFYMAPAGDSTKAYRLLAHVLEVTQRVGIATFIMRDREYLIAIIGEAGILRGETLRFLDEIRLPAEMGLAAKPQIDRRLLTRYERAIQALLKDEIEPKELEDEYSQRLEALIEMKLKRGMDVVEVQKEEEAFDREAEEDTGGGEDLLETIRRSLSTRARSANGKRGLQIGTNGQKSRIGHTASSKKGSQRSEKPVAKRTKPRGS